MEFKGKIAVITGGGSGIGLATARSFARQGVKLVLADIEVAALDRAVTELSAAGADVIGVPTDAGDRNSVEALAARAWSRFGAVHIVFNNAGVAVFGPTQTMSHSDWEWTMRVNLWGPIHGVESFVPRMIEQKQGGHVLFTASFAGLVGNRNLGPYSVSKAAVVSLAECLAKDVKQHGIGVSVLCPMRVESQIDDSHCNRSAAFGGPKKQVYADKESGALEGRLLSAAAVGDLVVASVARGDLLHHHAQGEREFRGASLRAPAGGDGQRIVGSDAGLDESAHQVRRMRWLGTSRLTRIFRLNSTGSIAS